MHAKSGMWMHATRLWFMFELKGDQTKSDCGARLDWIEMFKGKMEKYNCKDITKRSNALYAIGNAEKKNRINEYVLTAYCTHEHKVSVNVFSELRLEKKETWKVKCTCGHSSMCFDWLAHFTVQKYLINCFRCTLTLVRHGTFSLRFFKLIS